MAGETLRVVSVPVTDQERALHFYVDTLGFTVRNDAPMGEGMRWLQVVPPGGGASLTLVTWFPSMAPGSVQGLVLGTDDIDVAVRQLSGRGLAFGGPVETAPWGRFTTFDDPDGNGWVLQQDV